MRKVRVFFILKNIESIRKKTENSRPLMGVKRRIRHHERWRDRPAKIWVESWEGIRWKKNLDSISYKFEQYDKD